MISWSDIIILDLAVMLAGDVYIKLDTVRRLRRTRRLILSVPDADERARILRQFENEVREKLPDYMK